MLVMSWNVRYDEPRDAPFDWRRRWPAIEAVFADFQPDILGLQEVLPHQYEDLKLLFPEHESVGRGRDLDGGGEHCPIFYRRSRFQAQGSGTFWLSATPDCWSRGWDACLPRICTWVDLGELTVWNAHFDHLGESARENALEMILERAGEGRGLVVGDFNCELTECPPGWSFCTPKGGTYHEWDGSLDGPRIDYILATRHFLVLENGRITDGRYLSDHHPVWARLESRP